MFGGRCFVAAGFALTVGMLALTGPVGAQQPPPDRISTAHGGGSGNGGSGGVAVSNNGRYVAFSSDADNLVSATDSNEVSDAFLYDRDNGTTTRVSKSSSGTQGDAQSYADGVANDGTVVFSSEATNLVPNDTNGMWDVFVHEPDGDTRRVSISNNDGQGNGDSDWGSISADGTRVAFWTDATNLGGSPGAASIYLRDRSAQTTTVRATVESDFYRSQMRISGNGEYIVFATLESHASADQLEWTWDVYLHEISTAETTLLTTPQPTWGAMGYQPSISYSGRYVVFHGDELISTDTNLNSNIYLLDRDDSTFEVVSVATDGTQADEWSQWPTVSNDGQYVAFHSQATNLVSDDLNYTREDVFVRDVTNDTTTRLSETASGGDQDGDAFGASVAPGGGFVVFSSDATNLVSNDTNSASDVFEVNL